MDNMSGELRMMYGRRSSLRGAIQNGTSSLTRVVPFAVHKVALNSVAVARCHGGLPTDGAPPQTGPGVGTRAHAHAGGAQQRTAPCGGERREAPRVSHADCASVAVFILSNWSGHRMPFVKGQGLRRSQSQKSKCSRLCEHNLAGVDAVRGGAHGSASERVRGQII